MDGSAFSPLVKLSPNASYFLAPSATPFSVTRNEHDAWRDIASLAVQFTVVSPRGKLTPDAGAQVVVTGAVPCVTVGAA